MENRGEQAKNNDGKNGENKTDVKVFIGTFVHSTAEIPMEILENTALGFRKNKILFVEAKEKLKELKEKYSFDEASVTYMTPSQFLMPGMVDTHIHAPQLPNNGVHLDLPLLEWLQKYTFPTEARFSDVAFASAVYARTVDRVLRNGTTTASYFASLHLEATKALADLVEERGQRALVGRVNMVENCPEYYREGGADESLALTEEFLRYVAAKKTPLVQAVITPRFAPSCSPDLLRRLGLLAARSSCRVQSHLCESPKEVSWVKGLFPGATSYTDVYGSSGLLTEKTIMAHCVWMEEDELKQLKETGTGVSHCPNSNLSLRSGLCDVRELLQRGIKVGLGTDCSGGYNPSILDAMRRALHVSNTLAIQKQNYNHLSMAEVFRLATLGGAQVVHMEDLIGNFETNKEFDSLLIDVEVPGSSLDIFPKDTTEDKIQKFLYNGDDRNIVQVYVAGRCVINNCNVSVS